jgi:hypothetical protein
MEGRAALAPIAMRSVNPDVAIRLADLAPHDVTHGGTPFVKTTARVHSSRRKPTYAGRVIAVNSARTYVHRGRHSATDQVDCGTGGTGATADTTPAKLSLSGARKLPLKPAKRTGPGRP